MKVLVVDAEPAVRSALAELLAAEGHTLLEAVDGVEALTSVYRDGPDLVVLDPELPRLGGWVLCRMIKEDPATVSVPVIVLTTAMSGPDRFRAERSGADAIVAKEDLGPEVLERVRSLLARRALADLTGGVERLDVTQHDALARACEMLDRKLFETTVSAEMVAAGLRAHGLDEAMRAVLEALRCLVPFDVGAMGLLSQRRLGVLVSRPVSEASLGVLVTTAVDALGRVSGTVLTEGDVETVVLGPDPGSGPIAEWRSRVVLPVQDRGRVLGVLVAVCEEANRFGEQTLRTLRALTGPVAAVLESAGRCDAPTPA
jgi:DNA-binding response OmpR family regulator